MYLFNRFRLWISRQPRPAPSRCLALECLEQRALPDANGFVRGLFQEVLHRNPTQVEMTEHVAQLNAGQSRSDAVETVVSSDEHRLNEIRDDYKNILGHAPDKASEDFWLGYMKNGLKNEDARQIMLVSREFVGKQGGDNTSWLDGVYQKMLNRKVDDAGKQYWLGVLNATLDGNVVVKGIQASQERHGIEVDDTYKDVLNHPAAELGRNYWSEFLSEGKSQDDMVKEICKSQEFEQAHEVDRGDDPTLDNHGQRNDGRS